MEFVITESLLFTGFGLTFLRGSTSSLPMSSQKNESADLVKNSVLYKEFLAEREEILRHKWIESEKIGQDIGFERALLDWIVKYRSNWRSDRSRQAKA
jgi:hypothetical protein